MTSFASHSQLPLPVLSELQTQFRRIRPPAAAFRMWERVLTDQDRRRLVTHQDRERLLADRQLDANDRRHLEVDWKLAYWVHHGTTGMWMHLRGVSFPRAVIDIAFRIGFLDSATRDWLLRETGELHDDSQRTVDTATVQNRLVLHERPRQAFWHGDQIEIDWDRERALWSFLWELCRKSKRSQSVTHLDLGEKTTRGALSRRKERLVNHPDFPDTLGILVEPMVGNGYQLDLPPEEIRVFLVDEVEQVAEWTG